MYSPESFMSRTYIGLSNSLLKFPLASICKLAWYTVVPLGSFQVVDTVVIPSIRYWTFPVANIFKSRLFPSTVVFDSVGGDVEEMAGGGGLTVTEKVACMPLFAVQRTSVTPIGNVEPEV